jgi:hypothetical protein
MAAVLLVVSAASASAQAPAARTADGQPDIQGYWERGWSTPFNENIEEGAEKQHTVMADNTFESGSAVVDPPDGKVPYQEWAIAKRRDHYAAHYKPEQAGRDLVSTKCVLTGIPRIHYEGDFRILQTPGYVIFLYEEKHAYRIVPLDERPALGAGVHMWMGDSRGRWEGQTLVVDVANHNGKAWLDRAGNFYTDGLKMTERWTRVDGNRIDYQVTMEDSKVYTRPWTMKFTFSRLKQAGFELWEDSCFEGTVIDAERYATEAAGHPVEAPR